MTELERARAHLRGCQEALLHTRRIGLGREIMQWRERSVLAALSWVWEEQEKERQERQELFGTGFGRMVRDLLRTGEFIPREELLPGKRLDANKTYAEILALVEKAVSGHVA
jgi:hypothetical protein